MNPAPSAITIAIPVYNGAPFIRAAVESAVRQTTAPFEVLVIDDGSTDSTVEEVRGVRSSFVRLEQREHRGLAASRNFALEKCCSEYLAFLDADDTLCDTFIEQVSSAIRQLNADMVYTGYRMERDGSGPDNPTLIGAKDAADLSHILLTYGNIVSVSGTVIRCQLVRTLGGFSESLRVNCGCEDWDMWLRIARTGRAAFVPKVLVHKRFNRSGPYVRNPSAYREDMQTVIERSIRAYGISGAIAAKARANLFYLWANNEWRRGERLTGVRFLAEGILRFPRLPLWILRRPKTRRDLEVNGAADKPFHARVGVVQRVLPHYRTGFFSRLDERWNGQLEVFHGSPVEGDQVVEEMSSASFRRRRVETFRFGGYVIQPGAAWRLCSARYHVVVAEFSARNLTNALICWLRSLLGRPFVWWGSGYDPLVGKESFSARLKSAVVRMLLRRADAVIAYSEAGREYFARNGYDRSRIFLAPNSVDTTAAKAIAARLREDGSWRTPFLREYEIEAKRIVLFVGRLTPEKQLHTLLNACGIVSGKISDASLVIVGDGPERGRLETRAHQLGISHRFTGALYDEDILGKWFASASVFVLPGSGGLAIPQAMCYALPIICSVADGTEETLVRNDINGYRVPPGDGQQIAQAILTLLGNEDLRKRMGEASLEIVSRESGLEGMTQGFDRAVRCAVARRMHA
jgi:glycosyltransferase involved in cell wall biosynthesis